jgi:predicted DNA-binding transcriptional regulator AlpA
MQRFVRVKTWAKLAKMKRESVYKRIKSGRLAYSKYCEMPAIDIEEYPPTRTRYISLPPPIKRDLPDWCYD